MSSDPNLREAEVDSYANRIKSEALQTAAAAGGNGVTALQALRTVTESYQPSVHDASEISHEDMGSGEFSEIAKVEFDALTTEQQRLIDEGKAYARTGDIMNALKNLERAESMDPSINKTFSNWKNPNIAYGEIKMKDELQQSLQENFEQNYDEGVVIENNTDLPLAYLIKIYSFEKMIQEKHNKHQYKEWADLLAKELPSLQITSSVYRSYPYTGTRIRGTYLKDYLKEILEELRNKISEVEIPCETIVENLTQVLSESKRKCFVLSNEGNVAINVKELQNKNINVFYKFILDDRTNFISTNASEFDKKTKEYYTGNAVRCGDFVLVKEYIFDSIEEKEITTGQHKTQPINLLKIKKGSDDPEILLRFTGDKDCDTDTKRDETAFTYPAFRTKPVFRGFSDILKDALF